MQVSLLTWKLGSFCLLVCFLLANLIQDLSEYELFPISPLQSENQIECNFLTYFSIKINALWSIHPHKLRERGGEEENSSNWTYQTLSKLTTTTKKKSALILNNLYHILKSQDQVQYWCMFIFQMYVCVKYVTNMVMQQLIFSVIPWLNCHFKGLQASVTSEIKKEVNLQVSTFVKILHNAIIYGYCHMDS